MFTKQIICWEISLYHCIPQQKVANIDEVLQQHNQFLDNCMKDCLLTNSELLRTVYKMMLICINFSNFLLRMSKSTALDYLHMTKSSTGGSFDGDSPQGTNSGIGDLMDYTKGHCLLVVSWANLVGIVHGWLLLLNQRWLFMDSCWNFWWCNWQH